MDARGVVGLDLTVRSAAASHRGRASGIAAALAVASYVLNGLAPLVGALEPLQKVSLFYHYAASNPLREVSQRTMSEYSSQRPSSREPSHRSRSTGAISRLSPASH